MMNLKSLKHIDRDDLLNALGLESKPSTVVWLAEALGTFGVGLLVGAGLGLMLAPKAGRELRGDIHNRLCHTREDVSEPERGSHRS